MNVGKGQKVVSVETPPNGLRQTHLKDTHALEAALRDVESLLSKELKGQIASNQHCYVNLPHPLTVHNFRESHVPLFAWGEERVAGIEALFSAAVREMGYEKEHDDLKARANVIVREYRVEQYIPFHFDELECSELVLGMVLLNEAEGTGLAFRKGEGNNVLQYMVPEVRGCAFSLEGESRYSWTHGLLPCRGRRISITCRFYKQKVIDKWRAEMDALPADEPLPDPVVAVNEGPANVNVTLCDGRNLSTRKAMVVPSNTDESALIALFKQKLRLKVSKIALDKGVEWVPGRVLQNGDVIVGFK